MVEFFASDVVKIICLLVGVILMGVETLLPGLGIAGLSGLALMGVGTACMWIQHGTFAGLITLLGVLVITSVVVFFALRSAEKGKLANSRLILKRETQPAEVVAEVNPGDKGTALTALNPVGFALINEKRVEVFSEGGFVAKGTALTVKTLDGKKIIVD